MKTATRRYTNRQNMWIRNQLLPAARAANTVNQSEGGEDIIPAYVLDATGKSRFLCILVKRLMLDQSLEHAGTQTYAGLRKA